MSTKTQSLEFGIVVCDCGHKYGILMSDTITKVKSECPKCENVRTLEIPKDTTTGLSGIRTLEVSISWEFPPVGDSLDDF